MSQTIPAAPMRGFFVALVLGPDGQPDEIAMIFLLAAAVIIAGNIYNAMLAHHFDGTEFISEIGALISLHSGFNTLRGKFSNGK